MLPGASMSFIYKMMRKKNITLNGGKADGSEILKAGDEVKFFFSDETFEKFSGKAGTAPADKNAAEIKDLAPEEIVFENDEIIIVFKKAGELSQKVRPEDVSVNERIVKYLSGKETSGVSFTPGVCNRLDRNTEGLVIAAKNAHASAVVNGLLKNRKLEKYYLATVYGRFEKEITAELYLTKDKDSNVVTVSPEKTADAVYTRSLFYPVSCGKEFSLVRVKLETGKSHQIRAQLAYYGYPIAGDVKYGKKEINLKVRDYGIRSQMLLAYELVFPADFTELPGLAGRRFKAPISQKTLKFWKGEGLCLHGTPED